MEDRCGNHFPELSGNAVKIRKAVGVSQPSRQTTAHLPGPKYQHYCETGHNDSVHVVDGIQ